MINYVKLVLLFVLSYLGIVACKEFGPNSRIISNDGSFIFYSSANKSLKFFTNGAGKIMLNQGELTNVADLAQNASELLMKINNDFYETYGDVERFKRIILGHRGISDRLIALETGGTLDNSTTSSPSQHFGIFATSIINRKLNNLDRQVNRLTILLIKNECHNSPCENGGTCVDMFNDFVCHCPVQWEGPRCINDVNECMRLNGTSLGCQNSATCINKVGSYECACPSGWFGLHCTQQNVSCDTISAVEVCGFGTCLSANNGIGYKCLCDEGWTNNGTDPACIVDVNECASNRVLPCSVNPAVDCVNLPGSFSCGNCPSGYTGNGYYCSDVDECAMFNGGCSVNPMVECINAIGSRVCGMCPPGYLGDGITCTYKGVCGINNGGCHHLAQCRDNPSISSTYVQCICPEGYTGTGLGLSGCLQLSLSQDECLSNPCVHGTCSLRPITRAYVCHCTQKFTGQNCDVKKSPCEPNPCQNGATCTNLAYLTYSCICSSGYTGDTCEMEQLACGGHLRSLNGIIKYPSSGSNAYSSIFHCGWLIETNTTKVMIIRFTEFHLEDCHLTWLQIHDGRSSAAHTVGRFCGNQLPNGGMIRTTHNKLYILYNAESSVSHSSFSLNWESVAPECGRYLYVSSHGTLTSPGFPGKYPNNRDCTWSLETARGKRIQLHFFLLELGNNPNCSYDYLSIYQGSSESDHILAKFCNTTHPEPLYSSGFQIAYSVAEGTPGCGGTYTQNKGDISSPNIGRGEYPPDLQCEYKISVPENNKIKMQFLLFDIEDSAGCQIDFLEIHEGSSVNSPLIGTYCGDKIPSPYTSIGNQVVILFSTDFENSLHERGFRIKYEAICGGIFTELSGIISSPGYPSSYDLNQLCIYEIIQPLGTSITLQFSDFELEVTTHTECTYDFVEIHDGDNENSTLVGTYCTNPPPIIQSTSNYLWIKFQSDVTVRAKGFQANYTTSNLGCGGILKNKTGVIKTPKDSTSYPHSSNCTWIISAPPGNLIELAWSSFTLENSIGCSYDYVQVYDVGPIKTLMGKYCDFKLPPILISSYNKLLINFVSDISASFEGFVAEYRFIDAQTVCGGSYYTSSGILRSPNYPEPYPYNNECEWIISAPARQQIMLNITDFWLEENRRSNGDYLYIRNGGTPSSPLIGKYTGREIPKRIVSHANQMYLFFKSDDTVSERGFQIEWDSTATGCGGVLTSPRGSFSSPNYPQPYYENSECLWKIYVNYGSLIELSFKNLDIESSVVCLDYVEVFDGSGTSSPSLGKFCTSTDLPVLRSTANQLSVTFISDNSLQVKGFLIDYSTICINEIKGFRGIIESPNFPNRYPESMDCTWKITVNEGNNISLSFSHFNLEIMGTIDQNENYLAIFYTGETGELIKLDSYYQQNIPPLIEINSNHAEITFRSNNALLGNGFRFEWQTEGCGGVFTLPQGSFASPNFPNGYPHSTRCEWLIKCDYGSSIEITFPIVEMETDVECRYDYIMIWNGIDDTYPLLAHFCSKDSKPVILTSTGNAMFVRFVSDSYSKSKGFFANYTTVPTVCGGKLSVPSGTFHTHNYPKSYDRDSFCLWFIDVEDAHVVELSFGDIHLDGECNSTFVKVYDGSNTNYPLLKKLCEINTDKYTDGAIKSTSNIIVVEFRATGLSNAKGFLANYTTSCGAKIVTEDSGFITFRDRASLLHRTYNCSWTITAKDPTQHIYLTVIHRVSESCFETGYNKIYFFDGESNKSPSVGQYCEEKILPIIVSHGSSLHIEIQNPNEYFVAQYSVIDSMCGGTLTGEEGYFATPRYPNSFPIKVECEWTIRVSPGNKISLSFNSFDLIASEYCNLNFLEIRENDSKGKHLGTFCDTIPTNITQLGSLWLQFKSSQEASDNSGVSGTGFLAEYSLIHETELSDSRGEIASPLYPDYSTKLGSFRWRITVTPGKTISIIFKDISSKLFNDNDCRYSGVKIFDGFDESELFLGSFCGNVKPNPIKTSSKSAYIVFQNKLKTHVSKFDLEWLEVDKIPIISKKHKSCGSEEIIDMSNKTRHNLTSPGFPNGYTSMLDCVWILSTTPEYHLEIKFHVIDFEETISQCIGDKIKLFNGKEGLTDWNLFATVCLANATKQLQLHGGNLLKVVFESDSYSNGTGFILEVIRYCGGSIVKSNGVIAIDMYNEPETHTMCQWNITVRPGRTIKVSFLELSFSSKENDERCLEYLLFKNGHYSDSPTLGNGKYCSDILPDPLETTGNYLFVKSVGDIGFRFKIRYEEVSANCRETIRLSDFDNSTQISSPNYPNIPNPYTECYWVIIGPPGKALRVDFIDRFDLVDVKGCGIESVELFDGGTQYSPSLGRFCSNPSSIYSSGNVISLQFVTNTPEPRNGFKASISIAFCGGIIRGKSGELHSPYFNQKNLYPLNAYCVWHIIGSERHTLVMDFNSIDFKKSSNCTEVDHVSLSQPLDYNNTVIDIGTYCGTKSFKGIRSMGNEVIVKLVTSSEQAQRAGFSLSFRDSTSVCGGKLNSVFGVLQSPGYPLLSDHVQCHWFIIVPEGRRISLQYENSNQRESIFRLNFLSIFNDANYYSHILTTRYLNQSNSVIRSSGNTMYLMFMGTSANFQAKYSSNEPTICEGDFNQISGTLSSINASSYFCVYQNKLNVFRNVTLAMHVTLDVEEKTYDCDETQAVINVVAESLMRPTSIALFCESTEHPVIVRSPYSITQLRINQKNWTSNAKYNITYFTNPCGGVITEEEGFITSPGFSNKFESSIDCAWRIQLPEDQTIKINFTDINLNANCDLNYITLAHKDISFRSSKTTKYCQNNQPGVIEVPSNVAIIEYHSNERSNSGGFTFHYEPIFQGCSGFFRDKTKMIATPRYPKDYPDNTECLWEIQLDYSYHVHLEFIDRFHIEQTNNCTNDYVEIWDHKNNEYTSLGKYCGRETPPSFNSSSNKMKVMFRSNSGIRATGFKAKWTAVCGGTFEATSEKQYIVSPGYPILLEGHLNCTYNITSRGNLMTILFESFDIGEDCRRANVTITKSGNQNSVWPYCSTRKPPVQHVRNNVIINFSGSLDEITNLFTISYQIDDCGGSITKPAEVSSPVVSQNGVNAYLSDISCRWNITAPSGMTVVVRFNFFELEYDSSCISDYVEIYDGLNIDSSKRLAKLCGNLTHNLPIIKSIGDSMTIHMRTDYSTHFAGFKAEVYFTNGPSAGCGGLVIVNETATINSFIWPADTDCQWQIETARDNILRIHFDEVNLPLCNNSTTFDCSCSLIEIKDGSGVFSEIITRVCYNHIPPDYVTSGNAAWIRLYMKSESLRRPFKLTITKEPSICGPSVLNVTSSTQTLLSPLYPHPYPSRVRCSWLLQSSDYTRFDLHFTDFDLGEVSDSDLNKRTCGENKIEIFDSSDSKVITDGLGTATVFSGATLLPQAEYEDLHFPVGVHPYCGTRNSSFDHYTGNNQVILKFYSGERSHGRGFRMDYATAGCNRNYTSVQGRFIYRDGLTEKCLITITSPENTTISLYFLEFVLSNDDNNSCSTTGMQIRNGNSENSPLLGTLCGNRVPSSIFSNRNSLWIHFWNNDPNRYTIIDFVYTSTAAGPGCGGVFYNYMGAFTSPFYPSIYRKNATCTWEIEVPRQLKAFLKFRVFDIMGSCSDNFILVKTYSREGNIAAEHRFCENNDPAKLLSENNRITVTYKTTVNNNGSGWVATFNTLSEGHGGN